jgi:hypothetical protein
MTLDQRLGDAHCDGCCAASACWSYRVKQLLFNKKISRSRQDIHKLAWTLPRNGTGWRVTHTLHAELHKVSWDGTDEVFRASPLCLYVHALNICDLPGASRFIASGQNVWSLHLCFHSPPVRKYASAVVKYIWDVKKRMSNT